MRHVRVAQIRPIRRRLAIAVTVTTVGNGERGARLQGNDGVQLPTAEDLAGQIAVIPEEREIPDECGREAVGAVIVGQRSVQPQAAERHGN